MARKNIPTHKAARAFELVAQGYSRQDAANMTGVSRPTVADMVRRKGHWLQDVETPVFLEWRRRIKRDIQGQANELAVKLLAHADKNLEKTSPYQAVGMYGILRTHDRLDAGESTENVAVIHKAEAGGLDRLADRLAERLLGLNPNKSLTSGREKVSDNKELGDGTS